MAIEKFTFPDQVYTVNEACRLLKITRTTMLVMIKSGRIPAVDIRSPTAKKPTYRISRDALINFVNPKREEEELELGQKKP
jgi:excisionase family DNA binding protein